MINYKVKFIFFYKFSKPTQKDVKIVYKVLQGINSKYISFLMSMEKTNNLQLAKRECVWYFLSDGCVCCSYFKLLHIPFLIVNCNKVTCKSFVVLTWGGKGMIFWHEKEQKHFYCCEIFCVLCFLSKNLVVIVMLAKN